MSYYERNGIAYSCERGWNSDTFVKRNDMNSSDMPPIIQRLESEIITLRGALNLSRERAEDAESDLAHANQRADDAEQERDHLQAQLDKIGLTAQAIAAAEFVDREQDAAAAEQVAKDAWQAAQGPGWTPEQIAQQDAIAAELNRVMAENQRLADVSPVVAKVRKRKKVPA